MIYWIKSLGYLGIFLSLMVGMFGVLPDESILTFTGFLISKSYLKPLPAVTAAYLGSICGVSLNYLVGRTVGFPLLQRYGHHIRITGKHIDTVRAWFERHGKWSLFLGYFLPGVRHLAAFTAGASRLRFQVFAPYAFSGGLFWVLGFIALGLFLGEEWSNITPEIQSYLWWTVGILIVLGFVFFLARLWRLNWRKKVLH